MAAIISCKRVSDYNLSYIQYIITISVECDVMTLGTNTYQLSSSLCYHSYITTYQYHFEIQSLSSQSWRANSNIRKAPSL